MVFDERSGIVAVEKFGNFPLTRVDRRKEGGHIPGHRSRGGNDASLVVSRSQMLGRKIPTE
jgi:hypothetical protein